MAQAPRILADRYEVGELIGRGGMAEVHIGHDARLGRTVAIKILRSDLARDPSFQARFRREAQAAAALNHPAIVAVYDTGEEVYTEPTGAVAHVPFIVMEYVEGHTVRDILRDGHAVPIEEAIEIVSGVLSALEYSHQAGIVHRDIKPANVMLTPTGAVKVMDFGIARAIADSSATMTQTQAVIGTAQYLSPEQARGESVDARSDLYSTGCLLFELLTGRPPFQGDSPVAVAYQHVREAPPLPSQLAGDVPEVLDRITLKALAKERTSRYSTAAEFRADLESALHGGKVEAGPIAAVAAAATGAPTESLEHATQVFGTDPGPATQALPAASPWAPTGVAAAAGAGAAAAQTRTSEPEAKSRKALVWTLVVVALLALAGLIALLVVNSNKEEEPSLVQVPALAGMTQEQAQAELDAVGLEMRGLSEASTIEEGVFVRSEPGAGEDVEVGSTVDVYFSAGPDTVKVPDVSGMDQATAERTLREAKLEVSTSRESETGGTVPRNNVTRTDPEAGESVAEGTPVTLYISDGQIDVPSLLGMTEEKATAKLDEIGITRIRTTEQESEEEAGTVIDQQPAAGPIDANTTVTLVIAIPLPPELVQVPTDLVGLTEAEARDRLDQLGLNAQVESEASNERVAGEVFLVPSAGVQVEEGSDVVIYVSMGPGPSTEDPPTQPTDPTEPDDGGDG